MQTISRDTLLEIADAFGLGWECKAEPKCDDYFGPAIVVTHVKRGFLTRVTGFDHARRRGSKIADNDGYAVFSSPERWKPLALEIGYTGKRKTHTHFTQPFHVTSGSFAVTQVCGTPERIFLFTSERNFDVAYIIRRLKRYRREHPPSIFPDDQRKFYPHRE